jgi:hypothetical protein
VYKAESILKAYRLSRAALVRQLQADGVCGSLRGWTHDELVSAYLEKHGEREAGR